MQQNNPVYFIAGAVIGAIGTVITTLINSCFQNKRENKNWVKSELRNIYGGSVQSLATLLTLSDIESNMDSIEGSIVEAKKWLALSLIYFEPKQKEVSKVFEEEIYLFTLGQYKKFLETARLKGLQPSEKYQERLDKFLEDPRTIKLQPPEKYQEVIDVYKAADIMLKRIIEVARQDKRLF